MARRPGPCAPAVPGGHGAGLSFHRGRRAILLAEAGAYLAELVPVACAVAASPAAAGVCWPLNAGSRRASTRAPAMQARPPETTDVVAPKALATRPDSAFPIRGPPVTTASCTPISRPRSAS